MKVDLVKLSEIHIPKLLGLPNDLSKNMHLAKLLTSFISSSGSSSFVQKFNNNPSWSLNFFCKAIEKQPDYSRTNLTLTHTLNTVENYHLFHIILRNPGDILQIITSIYIFLVNGFISHTAGIFSENLLQYCSLASHQ